MEHKSSFDPRDPSDESVEVEIALVRSEIEAWATKHDLWYDSGFADYLPHTGREPSSLPVLSRLWSESDLARILQGDGPPELEIEFTELLERLGCWYEFDDRVTMDIYPDEDADYSKFSSYFHWQWVCSLVKEDIGDVYSELYSHFAKRPEDLYQLHWRDYEIILSEIFKTQGFDVELGPGRNDGGVDITLIQRDPIGDIVTFVQAKRYAPGNKIDLTEVQALYGAQIADGAQAAMFVTTSSYAPVAERFAARKNVLMDLATSAHVAEWAETSSRGIIEDKSSLISRDRVSGIIRDIGDRRDARVLHARSGYNCVRNEFALIVKETKHAALLMNLSSKIISDDGYGQAGLEVPNLDPLLPSFNRQGVVRAKRRQHDGEVSYWDGYHIYTTWDGNPCHFDLYD
ncbi:restriction endonuclease [Phaeobacter inhibens]|uniref:Restriction endonuclease n=1 Tax=Phaeobacter inhibens TaxID=221822 RepID=A0A2I7KFJ3_9RHOB|nr:restriction endonuclease [Phaeobacter inhibens]AUR01356.1 Restriction endonuclease [Phaeobacter inhibens]